MVSIIVPVLNEEKLLPRLGENLRGLCGRREIIFVDGHSADGSVELASRFGKVLTSRPGRARQMNVGASHACGDVLLFLHADCLLPTDALRAIERALRNERLVGGCLTQRFTSDGFMPMLSWIAFSGNLRARMTRTFFGDQAVFCRRGVFESIGGYPDVPIFEDVEFSRQLHSWGPTTVLSAPVFCSPRRWVTHGVLRTTLTNWKVQLGRLLHRHADVLVREYECTDVR